MAVVKANAYGHGLLECAPVLAAEGVDAFGVALVEEGVELRRAGISKPILVFGGILTDQIEVYIKSDLDLTASSVSKISYIDRVAAKLTRRARIHLKIDTGMGRIGVRPETAPELFAAAQDAKHCDVVGIFSHLATADESDHSYTELQTRRFGDTCALWSGATAPVRHLANSAAVIAHPDTYFEMVRPGIGLFGVMPGPELQNTLQLRPVMKVSSRIVYFKVVRAGESVSYGRSWRASVDSRIVTVPIGYGDGYPRALSNKGAVLIRGKRYPIVGRVCMDQILVNIGNDEAYNGDEVVLVGQQGGERITLEEIADQVGTIPYEILTALNLRIPRLLLRRT
jgi:alanine racemase